jgi:hypothetical protein
LGVFARTAGWAGVVGGIISITSRPPRAETSREIWAKLVMLGLFSIIATRFWLTPSIRPTCAWLSARERRKARSTAQSWLGVATEKFMAVSYYPGRIIASYYLGVVFGINYGDVVTGVRNPRHSGSKTQPARFFAMGNAASMLMSLRAGLDASRSATISVIREELDPEFLTADSADKTKLIRSDFFTGGRGGN